MEFSLLDLQTNDKCDSINFTQAHLISVATIRYLVKVKTLKM